MTSKQFLQKFGTTTLGLILSVWLLGVIADPFQVWQTPVSIKCQKFENPTLRKSELLSRFQGMEAMILGSSTSENFLPKDIAHLFGLRTFHASVAGSQSLARMILLKQALKNKPRLKKVFYASDFFECNDSVSNFFDPHVVRPPSLGALIPDKILQLRHFSFKAWVSQVLSFKVIEKSFKHIKTCFQKDPQFFYDQNGNTPSTKYLEGLGDKPDARDPVDSGIYRADVSEWLGNKIRQSEVEYLRGAYKDFVFSSRTLEIYKDIASAAKKQKVELHFILSPYHPVFLQYFMEHDLAGSESFKAMYSQWIQTMGTFAEPPYVFVHNMTESQNLFDHSTEFWRDGVHYNQKGSGLILKKILKELGNSQ